MQVFGESQSLLFLPHVLQIQCNSSSLLSGCFIAPQTQNCTGAVVPTRPYFIRCTPLSGLSLSH